MRGPGMRLAASVILLAMAVGCGDSGNGAGPRDDQIVAAIDDFWEGIGVPADKPHLFGYQYQTHESTKSCQHLAEEDRWYADRGSRLAGDEQLTQAELHPASIEYLERSGFSIERWRTSSREAPVILGLIAHKGADQTAIAVSVYANGTTQLNVRMGPCATPTLDAFTEPLYERVPDSDGTTQSAG